eukprot:CAMPEP_0167748744 /NCGR_PEP_ID=MMETSP0110_2-20121227/5008_1 /TAXON_ID=629695 /ORGANISM="Gymnochlora sp., Strain CCMP2014" /LENGTH=898 /DNA_ID=CAMNT_0007633793 /DNA_START=117 /DNA_END=2813 /DNA_ORIENTATION=+
MIVVQKDLDQSQSREKRFACTLVDPTILKDGQTVKLSIESKNYTKEVKFNLKWEAADFCKLLQQLKVTRGTAFRIFSTLVNEGKDVVPPQKMYELCDEHKLTLPEGFKLHATKVTFRVFIEIFLLNERTMHRVGAPRVRVNHTKSNSRRGIGLSMASIPSATTLLQGELRWIGPSPVDVMLSEKELRNGLLTLTNYRLIFQENLSLEALSIPVSTIKAVDTKKRGRLLQDLSIVCKDYRRVVFVYDPSKKPLNSLFSEVKRMAFPEKQNLLFAFIHKQALIKAKLAEDEKAVKQEDEKDKTETKQVDGWKIFSMEAEAERMNMLEKCNYLRVTQKNAEYSFSPSYPSFLVIPGNITDDQLDKIGKFRSKSRIPAVVYIHPKTKATITRCAQPMGGIQGVRCKEDEAYLNALRVMNPSNSKVIYLFDARPRIAALGNKAMGKGFENVAHYSNAVLEFFSIDNIHAVRTSLDQLMTICLSPERMEIADWYTKLAQCKWLHHLRQILIGAQRIVETVEGSGENKGASCVIHCSDGWDRTSQLTALAEMLLDPYFRSMKGFAALIEKEWISFGHKFEERFGHGHEKIHDQRSPVFVQFIDCVWQILRQHPAQFEFTEEFLIAILDHLYDCRFGTFLYNWESERFKANYKKKTESLWTHILSSSQADDFTNYLYKFRDSNQATSLQISTDSRRIVLWETYHMRYNAEYQETSMTPYIAALHHSRSKTKRAPSPDTKNEQGGFGGTDADFISILSLKRRASEYQFRGDSESKPEVKEPIDNRSRHSGTASVRPSSTKRNLISLEEARRRLSGRKSNTSFSARSADSDPYSSMKSLPPPPLPPVEGSLHRRSSSSPPIAPLNSPVFNIHTTTRPRGTVSWRFSEASQGALSSTERQIDNTSVEDK